MYIELYLDGPLGINWITHTVWFHRELFMAVFADSEHWNILHSPDDSLNDSKIALHTASEALAARLSSK